MRRQSGILMHISSLPSRYGIGTLGKAAYEFADFLQASGQSLWQVLPLGETGFGDSPYQSFSTFAGNPYFVDLEELLEQGLLEQEEMKELGQSGSIDRIDYGLLFRTRLPLLKKAASRGYGHYGAEEQDFYRENQDWLMDYALFTALKQHFPEKPYWEWPVPLRDRPVSYTHLDVYKRQTMTFSICIASKLAAINRPSRCYNRFRVNFNCQICAILL